MRYSIAPVAFAALAAALPQGVTDTITASTSSPPGCVPNYSGKFQIQVVNVTTPAKQKRQDSAAGALILTLQGGILKDAQGRTGYIADNRQLQFDGPPQAGAIITAGWSICANNTLAIGGDVIFEQCLSGTFYNLYDENDAAQCSPVYIEAINGRAAGGAASVQPDGQPINQIADGQPQAPTPVQQIGDGQIQAQTGTPVQQIGDGQIQAQTGTPVTQIGDGQIQAPTGVTQIADGQIQVPAGTGVPVAQISDGQVQAPVNGTVASPTVVPYTGAAALPTMRSELFGLAAGVLAFAML